MGLRGVGALLALVLSAHTTAAQTCARAVRPIDGGLGYQHRQMPDRCEGLYTAPFAGEALELLSYTKGAIAFDQKVARILIINAPDVGALKASKVTVVARALAPFKYYRMDVTVPSARSVQWPLDEVVLRAGLDPSKEIGILGIASADQDTVYVPLVVASANVGSAQNGLPPEMTFRASSNIDILEWRLYPIGGNPPDWSKYTRAVLAGDLVSLPVNIKGGTTMMMDVAARPRGSDFNLLRLRVFGP